MPKNSQTYYVTAAIPYINAKPHLGHVFEWLQADAIARYHSALGQDLAFASGADENSLKNVQAAEKAGKTTEAWLDEYSSIFKEAFKFFNISLTSFRRGSDQKLHWPGVQKLWKLCDQNDDIYKKTYTGLYCLGCEAFYTPDELIDGKCPEHFTVPEEIKEENYFFRLSKYETEIKKLIESDELRIVSPQFKNEMLGFINNGLQDFSVSRSVTRGRGFGVPVPSDPSQVMYVWFDALTIYMTAIGWGFDQEQFEKYWPADLHVIGKGINRFHSIYWIGMLLSAHLPIPKSISVHGYITADGQKMSKSLGNVIDPFEVVNQYGLEPIRYFLLKEIPSHSDGDFSHSRFKEVYEADLANGIGNLCSRIAKLSEKAELKGHSVPTAFKPQFAELLKSYDLDKSLQWLKQLTIEADQFLSEQQPWKQTGELQERTLNEAIKRILEIAYHLQPFMPETSKKILNHFSQEKITALKPLFPRLPV